MYTGIRVINSLPYVIQSPSNKGATEPVTLPHLASAVQQAQKKVDAALKRSRIKD